MFLRPKTYVSMKTLDRIDGRIHVLISLLYYSEKGGKGRMDQIVFKYYLVRLLLCGGSGLGDARSFLW